MNIRKWFEDKYGDTMHSWNRRICWLAGMQNIDEYIGYDESGYSDSWPSNETEPLAAFLYESAYVTGTIPSDLTSKILNRFKEILPEMITKKGEAVDSNSKVFITDEDIQKTKNVIEILSAVVEKSDVLTFARG